MSHLLSGDSDPVSDPPHARCADCPASKDGHAVNPLSPRSPKHPRLILVGERPHKSDLIAKRVFSSSAPGQVLRRSLTQAGIELDACHQTLACLCDVHPKKAQQASLCCAPRLAAELRGFDPEVPLVPLGTVAERVLTGHGNILKGRGFVWRVPPFAKASRPKRSGQPQILHDAKHAIRTQLENRVVFPTLDPGFIVRGAETWKGLLDLDLARVGRWVRAPFALEDEGPFLVCKTPAELDAGIRILSGDSHVVVDVETAGKGPTATTLNMVGFCGVDSMQTVQAFPWVEGMAAVVNRFLKSRTVVTHNGPAFDEIVLGRYGVHYDKKEDTLVAHHAIASHLRQSLDHCASNYTDAAPWKLRYKGQTADEKGGFGVSGEDLPVYNCADVRLSALVWKRMQRDLEPERGVYREDMHMADIARRMRLAGIGVDAGRRSSLSAAMRVREDVLLTQLRALTKRAGFSPTQAAAIREVLYGSGENTAGLSARAFTPTGEAATNRAVLEALRGQDSFAGRFANHVLEWRRARDSRTEYLDNLVVENGRVHPGWKSAGPETGRPACRDPNLLNMPRVPACGGCGIKLLDATAHKPECRTVDPILPEGQIRDIYVAKPGCKYVYFDLSQAEMRFAAFISGDENMMRACAGDVHAGNAMVLWPEHADLLRSDPKGRGKPFRDIAKNVGFAIAYLAVAETVYAYLRSKGFPVRLRDVTRMLQRLHVAYKGYYAFVARNVEHVQKHGYLRSVWSRRIRWMGWHPAPPMVANYPIQSGVADIMNGAIRWFDGNGMPGDLVMYAYDALVYEVPADKVDLGVTMITDYWRAPIEVPGTGRRFVQPIDVHVGSRLSEF